MCVCVYVCVCPYNYLLNLVFCGWKMVQKSNKTGCQIGREGASLDSVWKISVQFRCVTH